jgi:putative phage-type endonuclease
MRDSWLNAEEYEELEETVLELMDEYLDEHLVVALSSMSFPENLIRDICVLLESTGLDGNEAMNEGNVESDEHYDQLYEMVQTMFAKYWKEYSGMPARQQPFIEFESPNREVIATKIDQLAAVPKQQQRSKEWYEARYNMMTASSISKALGSPAQINSLICEKCKPLVTYSSDYVNCESPLHWGVKYEAVTAAIYEHMYHTSVATDFGCIPHRDYPFIGASPDGIVTDLKHERYGHMVEIKNIVNRDITGIPKDEYWIQMQLQLEVCDLEYCDFIETRIKEYESADDIYDDTTSQYMGIILHFVDNAATNTNAAPHYVYMPLSIPIDRFAIDAWTQQIVDEKSNKYVLYKTHYWMLDEISCIVVKRNRTWFASAVPQFVNVWQTILKERVDGYEHRVPKKKVEKPMMLIKLDENGNVV